MTAEYLISARQRNLSCTGQGTEKIYHAETSLTLTYGNQQLMGKKDT